MSARENDIRNPAMDRTLQRPPEAGSFLHAYRRFEDAARRIHRIEQRLSLLPEIPGDNRADHAREYVRGARGHLVRANECLARNATTAGNSVRDAFNRVDLAEKALLDRDGRPLEEMIEDIEWDARPSSDGPTG